MPEGEAVFLASSFWNSRSRKYVCYRLLPQTLSNTNLCASNKPSLPFSIPESKIKHENHGHGFTDRKPNVYSTSLCAYPQKSCSSNDQLGLLMRRIILISLCISIKCMSIDFRAFLQLKAQWFMLLKCSCLPCQKHAFGNVSGLLSLSSLLSASDCQYLMLKQTNYFKRQLLLCLFEFGSLGEWRGGTVRKVDSMPTNKEGQKKKVSKIVHLPECHLFSQRYHFKIHLRSELRFREPPALQHLNSVTPVPMSSLSACTFMAPSRMVLWCARCSLLGHAHHGIQLYATTTGQRAAPDSHRCSSAGFTVASSFLLCSALWFSATANFCKSFATPT